MADRHGISNSRKAFAPTRAADPGVSIAEIGDVVRSFLSAKAQYREKGRTKKTSRLELAIKRHIAAALNGDVGSAAMLLKMRAHGLKFGDTGPLIIQIVNSLPPFPYEVDDEQGRDQTQGAGIPWTPSRQSSQALELLR